MVFLLLIWGIGGLGSVGELFGNGLNGRVNFLGQVVDVDGKPLADVKVETTIRRWSPLNLGMATPAYYDRVTRVTDQDGRFSILNYRGDSLTVKDFNKAGFTTTERQRNGRGFSFDRVNGVSIDAGRPEVFVLLRQDSAALAERLVPFRFLEGVRCDGTPVRFDLLSGRKVGADEICDLVVRIERNPVVLPQRVTGQRFKYDWKAEITVVEGGLQVKSERLQSMHREDLELMYKAPENGYEPSYSIHVSKDAGDWSSKRAFSFFVRSRSGMIYGRGVLEIETDTDSERAGVRISGDLNPEGSRKLQKRWW